MRLYQSHPVLVCFVLFAQSHAFVVAAFQHTTMGAWGNPPTSLITTTALTAAASSSNNKNNGGGAEKKDEDFMRWAKQARSAEAGDTVVELVRPLGLILNQDEYGNVFVEKVAPGGNAARTGMVKEGDIITMCSATFGDQMWSTRGVGLNRVMAAIRLRSGATVKLVLETPGQYKKKRDITAKQLKDREEAAAAAQAKKDSLLKELEQDEQKLNPKKFFGLF